MKLLISNLSQNRYYLEFNRAFHYWGYSHDGYFYHSQQKPEIFQYL